MMCGSRREICCAILTLAKQGVRAEGQGETLWPQALKGTPLAGYANLGL